MASILIVGATGYIGSEIARSLAADGHRLRLAARDTDYGRRLLPQGEWVHADLNRLTTAASWQSLLSGIDHVVNASGILQSGGGDDVARIQQHAIVALAAACANAGVQRIVQISAAGISGNTTDFMTSKAAADAALLDGPVPAVILRPGLVLGRNAYGGSQLIRMAAALPVGLYPRFGRSIQAIALGDVVAAVQQALAADTVPRAAIDLVAETPMSLAEIIRAHRSWLGLPPWHREAQVPPVLMGLAIWLSDVLGWLGWRSPLRRNAVMALAHGVAGDAAATRQWLGREPLSLGDALAALPAGKQDRFAAWAFALLPLAMAALIAMWLLSGLATLIDVPRAAAIMSEGGLPPAMAIPLTVAGACADMFLAGLLLFRRWAQRALLGMAGLAAIYLLLGTILLPGLWLDPLAPYAKVLPTMMLALLLHPLLDRR